MLGDTFNKDTLVRHRTRCTSSEPQLIACASTTRITKEHVEFEVELLSRSRREIPITDIAYRVVVSRHPLPTNDAFSHFQGGICVIDLGDGGYLPRWKVEVVNHRDQKLNECSQIWVIDN
jgi:hypothetical protein